MKITKLKAIIIKCVLVVSFMTPEFALCQSNTTSSMTKPTPFKINIPQRTLDDLKIRLKQTRWPDEATNAGWTQGTNKEYLTGLVEYWTSKYDWRKNEAVINRFPQFTVTIDGIKIHFIHVKGKGKNPKPLILTHGWPDSFYRFHKVINMLSDPASVGANPEQSFDVIIPSVPGFGFSDHTVVSSKKIAALWSKLMTDVLGYKTFCAAGGDVGSGVTKELALRFPDLVEAIHLTDVGYPTGQEDFSTMTQPEKEFMQFVQGWVFREGAYAMLQMSKPQSLAYGLNDSPVGLAAWMLSMVSSGAPPEKIEAAFGGKDELLTNIMIYWVTETAGSSARMYFADAQAAYSSGDDPLTGKKSTPPAGITLFPREAQFPKEWAERSVNVAHFSKMAEGGHFAALEVPEVFSNELRSFFFVQLADKK